MFLIEGEEENKTSCSKGNGKKLNLQAYFDFFIILFITRDCSDCVSLKMQ